MWQCADCEYHNDDWDESCAKCEVPRSAPAVESAEATLTDVVAPEVTETAEAAATSDATVNITAGGSAATGNTDPKPAQPDSTAEKLLVAVIVLIVISIAGSAIIAWKMGLLTTSQPAGSPGSGTSALTSQGGPSGSGGSDPDLPEIPARHSRRFTKILATLSELSGQLSSLAPQPGGTGVLSAEDVTELTQLHSLGEDLAGSYDDFEHAIADAGDPELAGFASATRAEFQQAFNNCIAALGSFRAVDFEAARREYLLSDELPAAADAWGYLDTTMLKESWLASLNANHQLELDLEYTEIYRQLEARIAALIEVHSAFNASLDLIEPYRIRSGIPGAAAKAHLESLDSYAVLVEGLVLEFQAYHNTIAQLEESNRLAQMVDQFVSLAQQDHQYCFTECYEIYVKDKQLEHPVYSNLKQRFSFVVQAWPKQEGTYQNIAAKYESDWIRMWRPDVFAK